MQKYSILPELTNRDQGIDFFGVVLMLIFSLGYILHGAVFSELHIRLSFLDFPVFIGELLLMVCLVLFLCKRKKKVSAHKKLVLIGIFYGCFVLIKAFYGYFQWGPLAFRHAALFYYPLFIMVGYEFWNRCFFTFFYKIALFIIFFMILIWPAFNNHKKL